MSLSAAASELVDALHRARLVVFDFDGTLVDSNAIKQRAFAQCFAPEADRLEEIMAYCGTRHHAPRWEKFRHVYERILRKPYTPDVAAALMAQYAAQTTRQIIAAPEIPGAAACLRMVSRARATALLSSTPQKTLQDIISQRGWSAYFGHIQGAPVNKMEWLAQARHAQGGGAGAVLFFGDTPEDSDAAGAAGCAFVGVGAGALLPGIGWTLPDWRALDLREDETSS